jgi:hypothetical protein
MKQKLFTISGIIICLVVMFACGNTRPRNEYGEQVAQNIAKSGQMAYIQSEITEIDIDKVISVPMHDIISKVTDIRYVYLKTEEPIGEIRKITVYDNRIYIFDPYVSEEIFIFDMDGNLIKRISDKGGGPMEYVGLMDMIIYNGELVVADRLSPKRLYYTLDGEYIRTEKSLFCSAFASINGKYILHLNAGQTWDDNLTPQIVVSTGDSAIRRALPYYNIQKGTFPGDFHVNSKGELLFMPTVCDTIYQILSDSTYTAKYHLKDKRSVWKKANEDLSHDQVDALIIHNGYIRFVSRFYETEANIHFRLNAPHPSDPRYLGGIRYWYNKNNRQVYKAREYALEEMEKIGNNYSKENKFHIITETIATWNNYYIGVIKPESIEDAREIWNHPDADKSDTIILDDEWLQIIKMDDDPNQALVFYKLDFDKK